MAAMTPNDIEKFNIFNRPNRLNTTTPKIIRAVQSPRLKASAKSFLKAEKINVPIPHAEMKKELKNRNFTDRPT
jgi:hypothetical protein